LHFRHALDRGEIMQPSRFQHFSLGPRTAVIIAT
jgi:hypothetical protein